MADAATVDIAVALDVVLVVVLLLYVVGVGVAVGLLVSTLDPLPSLVEKEEQQQGKNDEGDATDCCADDGGDAC